MIAPLLALALAVGDPAGETEALKRIYEPARAALVQVGADPYACGVVIDEQGLVLTAARNVEGAGDVMVTFANGFKASFHVMARDPALNVALLQGSGLPPMAFVATATARAQVGQASYAIATVKPGQASAVFARVATAEVVRDDKVDERYLTARYALDARVSGAPVLGYSGELIGLVLASDKTGTGFALGSPALLDFVEAHAVELPATAVRVESDPHGATVLLDGKEAGRAPLELAAVTAGRHVIQLRSPGLPDTLRPLTALGPAQKGLQVTLFPGAAVSIRTDPAARVEIDGLDRGAGSTTLWLPGGRHAVRVSLKGRHTFEQPIEVIEDRPVDVDASLPEARALLSVNSDPPGADVLVDDNHVGQTPLVNVPLAPGSYEVVVARAGSHAFSRVLSFADGAATDLGTLKLEPPSFTLKTTVPAGTTVSVDGKAPVVIPAGGLSVAPGSHTAVFYAPYQYRVRSTFSGVDGQVVALAPTFVAAGDPNAAEVPHVLAGVIEGAGGLTLLLSGTVFLAAEAEREGNGGLLPASGHSTLTAGLIVGGVGLALYTGGALLEALQPTADMGHGEDAPTTR